MDFFYGVPFSYRRMHYKIYQGAEKMPTEKEKPKPLKPEPCNPEQGEFERIIAEKKPPEKKK